ncbi:MAG TPA: 50S ribosomal protein L25/general stress protein Ctc [Acidobacteriota bacterium]|nr:50S ribosomal protein L25/general stress protein Ctc [Acidobacteriota bacterium]
MIQSISVNSALRELKGKGPNRRLRRSGRIPAVLYGHKSGNVVLEVDPKDIFKILRSQAGENTIFQLQVPGRELVNCLIKEYQLEPVSHELLHADFYEVAMDETLEVKVPLVSRGEAYGVKTEGGLLDIVHRELHVECLPADIPEHIEVDVTNLKIGDLLRVRDLQVSDKIKILDDPETVVIAVEHPRAEELPVAAPAEAEAEAEPEVIKKGKAVEAAEEEAAEEK